MSILLEQITLSYGSRTLLSGVCASFAPGTLTALIGRNGTGKSTLLRAIAGLGDVTAGSVELCGHPLTELSARQLLSFVCIYSLMPCV